jgi:DNA gyrase subunit A
MDIENPRISAVNIEDEMKGAYLDYAMSVIVGRALPDVRDGLKPVHRRVLYAMEELGNHHNKAYKKSARVVGDVIGKYHPHGDTAVYDTIVRMAQPFSMRYPLVDGQGNFGSIDGDSAAAMRYTEVRMSKIASELLADLDKETVDEGLNYDDSLKEPLVLPTKIPNFLVNGSSGIAVGMATNVPPHNMTEVLKATIALLDDPTLSLRDIIQMIPGPDFPTGGIINGNRGIVQAYTTGRGVIEIRAKTEIEVNSKGDRESIIIQELPYQVNKAKLMERIALLVRNKQIEGISDLRDESDRDGIRVVIELKKSAMGQVVLNSLYKLTPMSSSFGINLLALHRNVPKVMNLKEVLQAFIDHRRDVVTRRTIYELRKARARAHILEGLVKALDNLEEVIELIKGSKSPAKARESLINRFKFSEKQSQAILDMKLQRLTGLEREKITKEYQEVLKLIQELKTILNSDEELDRVIKEELDQVLEEYGDERKSVIQQNQDEILTEDLIADEPAIVTVTHHGYIKRVPGDTYRSQGRGGKGVRGAAIGDEDFVSFMFRATTHDSILVFTDSGRVYKMKVYQIPEGSRTSKGRAIVNLLSLDSSERIRTILPIPEFKEQTPCLVMATKKGLIKKTDFKAYSNIRANGLIACQIREGDELLAVDFCCKDENIMLTTKKGKGIRFSESQVRSMGRQASGVLGCRLAKDDEVVSMAVLREQKELFTVTQKGFGKKTRVEDWKAQSRGGKGIISMKINGRSGDLVAALPVVGDEDLILVTDRGQVIRTSLSTVSTMGRSTQGVKVLNVASGEKVTSAVKITEDDEEDTEK